MTHRRASNLHWQTQRHQPMGLKYSQVYVAPSWSFSKVRMEMICHSLEILLRGRFHWSWTQTKNGNTRLVPENHGRRRCLSLSRPSCNDTARRLGAARLPDERASEHYLEAVLSTSLAGNRERAQFVQVRSLGLVGEASERASWLELVSVALPVGPRQGSPPSGQLNQACKGRALARTVRANGDALLAQACDLVFACVCVQASGRAKCANGQAREGAEEGGEAANANGQSSATRRKQPERHTIEQSQFGQSVTEALRRHQLESFHSQPCARLLCCTGPAAKAPSRPIGRPRPLVERARLAALGRVAAGPLDGAQEARVALAKRARANFRQ